MTWIKTLFAYTLDQQCIAYLWDLFLITDFSVFIKFSIGIIAQNEKRLMQMDSMDLNIFFKSVPSMKQNGLQVIRHSIKLKLHVKYIDGCRDLSKFDWHGNGRKAMHKKYEQYKKKEREKKLRKDIIHNKLYNKLSAECSKECASDSSMISGSNFSSISKNMCTDNLPVLNPTLSPLKSGEMCESVDGNYDYSNKYKDEYKNESESIEDSNDQNVLTFQLSNSTSNTNHTNLRSIDDDDSKSSIDVCIITPSYKNMECAEDIASDDEVVVQNLVSPEIVRKIFVPIPISLLTPTITDAGNNDNNICG